MFASGTKGKLINLQNIVAALGSVLYKGKRAPLTFSFLRSSPYSPTCDFDPRSRGFTIHSFIEGLSVSELLHSSM
jgi:DNA-directed RNA polymerase beta' subunit